MRVKNAKWQNTVRSLESTTYRRIIVLEFKQFFLDEKGQISDEY
jgi:hypothetical protein